MFLGSMECNGASIAIRSCVLPFHRWLAGEVPVALGAPDHHERVLCFLSDVEVKHGPWACRRVSLLFREGSRVGPDEWLWDRALPQHLK